MTETTKAVVKESLTIQTTPDCIQTDLHTADYTQTTPPTIDELCEWLKRQNERDGYFYAPLIERIVMKLLKLKRLEEENAEI